MTTVTWLGSVVIGFALMVVGSGRAVTYAGDLARGSRLPPFFVGMTLLAIGTDLPEIANSIVASFTDNGDINVGDSIGSAATQMTLVLGLLPFVAASVPLGERGSPLLRGQQATAWLTAGSLLLVALVVLDDHIGRIDAVVLIVVWILGSRLIYRCTRSDPQLALADRVTHRVALMGRLVGSAAIVGAGATLAVIGLNELAMIWGVPPFVMAFFGASIGTSLPELVVDITALRRGQGGLAVGDVLGSSFVDATLSISIGPLLFPTAIDGRLALTGAVVAAGSAVVVGLLIGRGGEHTRPMGGVLLVVYAAIWAILL